MKNLPRKGAKIDAKIREISSCSRKAVFEQTAIPLGVFAQNHDWPIQKKQEKTRMTVEKHIEKSTENEAPKSEKMATKRHPKRPPKNAFFCSFSDFVPKPTFGRPFGSLWLPFGSPRLPKGAKGEPKGAKREPEGAKREPTGAKREPKGAKREPKGAKREPRGPKRLPGSILAPFW